MPFLSSKIRLKPVVGDERERMRRVDRLRRQDREDLLAEMLVEPGLGLVVERLVADHADMPASASASLQRRPDRLLAGDQRVGLVGDRRRAAASAVSPSARQFLDARAPGAPSGRRPGP